MIFYLVPFSHRLKHRLKVEICQGTLFKLFPRTCVCWFVQVTVLAIFTRFKVYSFLPASNQEQEDIFHAQRKKLIHWDVREKKLDQKWLKPVAITNIPFFKTMFYFYACKPVKTNKIRKAQAGPRYRANLFHLLTILSMAILWGSMAFILPCI